MNSLKMNVGSTSLQDAISTFLSSPPEGTPLEVIEAFEAPGVKEFLPPKLFLETVEQAPVAISITSPSAEILYVNKAFEALTGYSRDDVVGRNESVLSSKSTPAKVYQDLWSTIQSKRVWNGKLANHRKDKQEYLADLMISPVLGKDGEIAYFLGMHRDITALHQLERQLSFQKRLIEGALDSAPMVVSMVDSGRQVLLDNQAYKALQGDFRGVEPADMILDALETQIGLGLDSAWSAESEFTNVEVRLEPPGGKGPRWFICSGVLVEDPEAAATAGGYFTTPESSPHHLMLIANEVTSSRQRINEARMNLIRANMTEQQLVQTMREAISGSIYKLQEPLNVIRAALNIPESSENKGTLRNVLWEALSRGSEAIENLQDAFPSPKIEQVTRVNINEILHQVINLSTDTLLASGIVIDWRPAPILPTVAGRENALRGLFKYLIDNAIAALNESNMDFRELRIGTQVDGDELVIEIIDSGPGIPEKMRLKIFEPFFFGWENPKGHAGMGLTMAQEVIISHGGGIEVDSDFLGGCRIFVRLPTAPSDGEVT